MSSTLDSAVETIQGVNQANVAAAAAAREEQAEIASHNADLFGWGATSPTVQPAPLEPAQPAAGEAIDDGGMGLWGAPAPAPPPEMPPTGSQPSMASQPSVGGETEASDAMANSAHSSVPDRTSLSSVGGMEPPAPAPAPAMEAMPAWGESSVVPSVAAPPPAAPMPSDVPGAAPFGAAPQQPPPAGPPFGMAYGAPATPVVPPAGASDEMSPPSGGGFVRYSFL